jgi:hypothetical protein
MAAARTPSQLDVYDTAYLVGGRRRMVDTAIVALVRSGQVRIHSPGQLVTVELTRRHAVEAAVFHAVGPRHRSVDTIQWFLQGDSRLLGVDKRLRSDGLLARINLTGALRRNTTRVSLSGDGRRALGWLREQRGDTDDTWRVAINGRAAMRDARLRTAIFEQPRASHDRGRRTGRDQLLAEDPRITARDTLGTPGGFGAIDGGGF